MKKLKIGDEVQYAPWTGPNRTARVERIETCRIGEKYGTSVQSADLETQKNGVVDLNDGHWAFFDQIIRIIKPK